MASVVHRRTKENLLCFSAVAKTVMTLEDRLPHFCLFKVKNE